MTTILWAPRSLAIIHSPPCTLPCMPLLWAFAWRAHGGVVNDEHPDARLYARGLRMVGISSILCPVAHHLTLSHALWRTHLSRILLFTPVYAGGGLIGRHYILFSHELLTCILFYTQAGWQPTALPGYTWCAAHRGARLSTGNNLLILHLMCIFTSCVCNLPLYLISCIFPFHSVI